MSLDGSVYIVRLLEVDLKKVQFDHEKNILWPGLGKDYTPPTIDGVLVLHDATQPDKFAETRELIGRLMVFAHEIPRYNPPSPGSFPHTYPSNSGVKHGPPTVPFDRG